jgi:hypothetical protein
MIAASVAEDNEHLIVGRRWSVEETVATPSANRVHHTTIQPG